VDNRPLPVPDESFWLVGHVDGEGTAESVSDVFDGAALTRAVVGQYESVGTERAGCQPHVGRHPLVPARPVAESEDGDRRLSLHTSTVEWRPLIAVGLCVIDGGADPVVGRASIPAPGTFFTTPARHQRMKEDLMDIICCPLDKHDLELRADEREDDEVISGSLVCTECGESYQIEDGIPNLLPPDMREDAPA